MKPPRIIEPLKPNGLTIFWAIFKEDSTIRIWNFLLKVNDKAYNGNCNRHTMVLQLKWKVAAPVLVGISEPAVEWETSSEIMDKIHQKEYCTEALF